MRERLSIFLLSAAIIGFQLAIIQILSYSQWHHFAYLAVSIAMLGFGSSGVILSLYSGKIMGIAERLMPWLFTLCGVLIIIAPMLINSSFARFDPFLLFASSAHLLKFFLTCFILFLPFLVGAVVIGLFFMIRSQSIPLLYAWNLAGSALGGVGLIALSYWLMPMPLASIFGFAVLGAGWLLSTRIGYRVANGVAILAGMVVLLYQPQLPYASEFKSLAKTLDMPETQVESSAPSPQGVYQVVTSESLRQAQGLSLSYTGSVPLADMAFLNAQAYCAFERLPVDTAFYSNNLFALPYIVGNATDALILEPPSTFNVSQALWYESSRVTVVEPLQYLVDSLTNFPWAQQGVEVVKSYPRNFLANSQEEWSAIVFPTVGTFGGSAGIASMQEQYLLTTKATELAFQRLNPGGVLAFSSYMDNPPRFSPKLLALAIDMLVSRGLDPQEHTIAVRNWNSMVLLVGREPFSASQVAMAKEFCSRFSFDMVYPYPASQRNVLSDSTFHNLVYDLMEGEQKTITQYPFSLKPPSDNSPFFSQFLRISSVRSYAQWFGISQLPFLELGYLVVWVSLLVCIVLSIFVIAVPLFASLRRGTLRLPIWFYFASLGLGYMLIEMALIQRSILALGNPITASAVIISALLCFSAVGSYYSGRLPIKPTLIVALTGIAVQVTGLALFGDSLSYWLLTLPLAPRVFMLVLSVIPLSIVMGMAFPTGMRHISASCPEQIPIAWGVNGFFSVLAAPLGTILAVEIGFTQVFLLSALLYTLCIPFGLLTLQQKSA